MSRLNDCKGFAKPSVVFVQNENKVTRAVHHLKMTCFSETQRILHCTRLTVTEELNSGPLFPPENI